jgi:hypothetical protein
LNEGARQFSVPKATFKRHEDGKNIHAPEKEKDVAIVDDILQDTKEEIAQHILKLEQCLFVAAPNELRTLAFSVAERARAFHTDLTENRKWRIRNGCMHL